MENKITIDEKWIKMSAPAIAERELTPEEVEEVFNLLWDDIGWFVDERIHDAVSFLEMMKRNKNADDQYPHFEVYSKNPNAYQNVFSKNGTFKTEKDARHYIHYQGCDTPYQQWRIVKVISENSARIIDEIKN